MDGVALCARFSIATNRLQFCGPMDAEPALYRAITTARGDAEAREHLSRFEALMPYLEAIGRKHGLDPFDRQVVEAYWVGNSLLDALDAADFRALLDALVRRGLPRSFAQRLGNHLPSTPLFHHAFHVSFVGVGNVTGHVETTLANMEACRPAWGTVHARSASTLTIERSSWAVRDGRLVVGPTVPVKTAFDPRVLPELGVGAPVVLHWGWPALQLEERQRVALEEYSRRSIESANEALPGLHVLS
ncbi:MAG TPA: DUF6390 family protein [Thermoplasmata archaeon]|nr:DUF6390 family protein [Thermoplasmata archaeon]